MYRRVALWGFEVSSWNAMLVLGIAAGYLVLRQDLRTSRGHPPRHLLLRWAVTVYGSLLGAQLFAYAFDRGTSFFPPGGTSSLRYYLDPLAGPKTLYGAIVFLPFTVLVVSAPWRDLPYGDALDAWTAPLCTVLAAARGGCFLQGCCYGMEARGLGIAFPPESLLYWEQLQAGRITEGAWTAPVVPTQLLEAAGLAALAGWAWRRRRRGEGSIFVRTIVGYSVLRFGLEFLRADPVRNAFGPLSTSQWIALVIVVAAGAAAARRPSVEAAS